MDEQRTSVNSKTSLLIGIVIAIVGLFTFSKNIDKNRKFDELALGKNVTVEFGSFKNYKIHCQDLKDIDQCLYGYKHFGKNMPVILWLGNSQLHAINQFKQGDEVSSVKLHRYLKKHKNFLLTASQPNSNLQEHLILASYFIKKLPVKKIILPIVFDDMRENNIRIDIENSFEEEEISNFIKESSQSGKNLYQSYQKRNLNNYNNAEYSMQEKSEKILNTYLKEHWSLWSLRENLRGETFGLLYRLRNYIFRINPSSTRKIIQGHYKKNIKALKDLIYILNKNNIEIFIYIVPIRNDLKIPYNLDEYDNFKKEIRFLAQKNNIKIKNFENLIPNSFWGKKDSTSITKKKEIDFMHFQSRGHDLLAEAIYKELNIIPSK